jgi:mannose-6-phosphate isomerase-like protein (cupin superfamily)
MSDSDAAMPNVFAPDDIVWHETDLGQNFWISDELVGTDYSTLFSAQLTKFGPGGGSPLHHHTYKHAFYFLSGTARVQMGDRTWNTKPGTLVKVPAHLEHNVTNTATEDLIFLVIYDPPHVATD